MKTRYIRTFFIILLAAWMALIFYMSSREADASAQMSNTVGMEVGRIFIPHFTEWSQEEQEAFAEKIDHPVRKTAHAGEYAVLGILWTGTLCTGTGMSRRTRRTKAGMSDRSRSTGTDMSGETRRTEAGMSSISWGWRLRSVWYKAWILASLYAASDEFHQLFVAGRSGQVSDVILDSAGALAGIALVELATVIGCKLTSEL